MRQQIQLLYLVAVVLVLLLLGSSIAQAGSKIQIKFASLNKVNGNYQLNVDADIVLNPTLKQALKKGVALYFVTRFGLVKPRWYWFDEEIARGKIRVELSYYALTRRYRLRHGVDLQSFNTLPEALRVLSRLRSYPVTIKTALETNVTYIATLRVWLDLQRLHKPFQIETIGSEAWNLTSERLEWSTKIPLSVKQLYQQGDL